MSQPIRSDQIVKSIDDYMWHLKLSDIAVVDQVSYISTPPHYEANSTGQGAGNPMIVYAYTFVPKNLDRATRPTVPRPAAGRAPQRRRQFSISRIGDTMAAWVWTTATTRRPSAVRS